MRQTYNDNSFSSGGIVSGSIGFPDQRYQNEMVNSAGGHWQDAYGGVPDFSAIQQQQGSQRPSVYQDYNELLSDNYYGHDGSRRTPRTMSPSKKQFQMLQQQQRQASGGFYDAPLPPIPQPQSQTTPFSSSYYQPKQPSPVLTPQRPFVPANRNSMRSHAAYPYYRDGHAAVPPSPPYPPRYSPGYPRSTTPPRSALDDFYDGPGLYDAPPPYYHDDHKEPTPPRKTRPKKPKPPKRTMVEMMTFKGETGATKLFMSLAFFFLIAAFTLMIAGMCLRNWFRYEATVGTMSQKTSLGILGSTEVRTVLNGSETVVVFSVWDETVSCTGTDQNCMYLSGAVTCSGLQNALNFLSGSAHDQISWYAKANCDFPKVCLGLLVPGYVLALIAAFAVLLQRCYLFSTIYLVDIALCSFALSLTAVCVYGGGVVALFKSDYSGGTDTSSSIGAGYYLAIFGMISCAFGLVLLFVEYRLRKRNLPSSTTASPAKTTGKPLDMNTVGVQI